MRIYPDDYIPRLDCHANQVSVTLDGVKLERVLWADEDEGLVCVAKLDGDENVYLASAQHMKKEPSIASTVLSGTVCIHPPIA
jgi:hypothetical protein